MIDVTDPEQGAPEAELGGGLPQSSGTKKGHASLTGPQVFKVTEEEGTLGADSGCGEMEAEGMMSEWAGLGRRRIPLTGEA